MSDLELQLAVERLHARYAQALDAGRLEEWPEFFTEDGRYRIATAENEARGLPLPVLYAEGRAMLRDRIAGRAKETGGARADDTLETLAKRLAIYHAQTAPVADYYRRKGMLKTVDGMGTMDQVGAAIENLLSAVTEA